MPSRPPNILLAFSDQQSARHGLLHLDAPHQDRLAREGTRFRAAYCVAPQCTPARAALLTGLYPHTTGVETNLGAAHAMPLSPRWPTFAVYLQQAGYQTAYFGKWHVHPELDPTAFGFDVAYCPAGHGKIDQPVTDRACAWLESARPPWLLVVSYGNPHDIYQITREHPPVREGIGLPPSLDDTLAGKPEPQRLFLERDQGRPFLGADAQRWLEYRSYYADLIERVDRQLGRLLAVLDRLNARDGTCIIYTADHGDLCGAHALPFKGPFLYEELVRVPLLIRWPGGVRGGSVRDELVSHLDLLPTILELAGVSLPEGYPGRSLCGLFDERRSRWRQELFFEYLAKQQWVNPIRGIRSGRYKLNHYLWSGLEMYDLLEDPHEMHNLAHDPHYAGIRREMERRLELWRRATGDAGRWESPPAGAASH